MQIQITETLNCVLGLKERRRLEVYDTEKMAVLYKVLLDDNAGLAEIGLLITQLNEKARKELEEEEKRRKRKNAISDASKSYDNGSFIGREISTANGVNQMRVGTGIKGHKTSKFNQNSLLQSEPGISIEDEDEDSD